MAKVIAVSSRAQHGAKRGFHNEEKCCQMQENLTAASMASYTETEKRFYVPYFSKYMTRGRKDIRAETESLRTSKVPPLITRVSYKDLIFLHSPQFALLCNKLLKVLLDKDTSRR